MLSPLLKLLPPSQTSSLVGKLYASSLDISDPSLQMKAGDPHQRSHEHAVNHLLYVYVECFKGCCL